MIIPRAIVDIQKLRNYCLNPQHRRGCYKARIFASRLGLTAADADYLREALRRAVREHEAVPAEVDEYGKRYAIDFMATGPAGDPAVRSHWIIRHSEDFPRLTSCFVLLGA